MNEVEDVFGMIERELQVLPVERVPRALAQGRVLARDILADSDQPPFDRSAMDGYAILDGDSSAAFRLMGEIRAGGLPSMCLKTGETIRVMTGAALPDQPVRVVMQEEAQAEGGNVSFKAIKGSKHVRKRGEDFKAGDLLLKAGRRLGAVDLAVLASMGVMQVEVVRNPRIIHWVTGDEVVDPEDVPAEGQIRDVNGPLISGLLGEIGSRVERFGRWKDQWEEALARWREGLEKGGDLFLISGGASVGAYDWTRRLLEETGFSIHCSRVNHRPGKPLLFATRGEQAAFGIPGNPVSHFVCFHLFIARAVRRMRGEVETEGWTRAHLACSFQVENDRPTLWPCRILAQEGKRIVEPLSWNSSGHLSALIPCEGLLRLPRGRGDFREGDVVEVFITAWVGGRRGG